MDRGLGLSLLLILTAWALIISGLYLIAKALVPLEAQNALSAKIIGIFKVIGAFLFIGSLLYAWFLLTRYLVTRFKTKSRIA